jgi:hypothetical protein
MPDISRFLTAGSYALDRSAYYTTASWWLDRAYFGTPKVTPWMRPGHFSWILGMFDVFFNSHLKCFYSDLKWTFYDFMTA